jgi:quinol monooxygenase YgiN
MFMILATVRMVMPHEKFAEAAKILARTAERTRVETGCDRCHVYRDAGEAPVILLEEAWKSDEDLDHHLRSDGFRDVLVVMEMALEPPEIQFSTIARMTGMERARAARSQICLSL